MELFRELLAEDVASSSASVLCNLLPEIMKLDPREMNGRLADHLRTTIRAYCDALCGWGLESVDDNLLRTLNADTKLAACLAEFRGKLDAIHQLAVPELRTLLDTHDFPFSTTNAVLAFGRRLLKSVLDAKEALARLHDSSASLVR